MTSAPPPLDPHDVASHAASVLSLAQRLLQDSGAAEDAAQEAWLVALRTTHRPTGSIGSWVRGVLRNVVRHARRDAATRQRHESALPPRAVGDDPADVVARTELHHRLVGAVLALDEPYRGTILARYFEGLDAAAIARQDGVPAGTVRSRLKRGLDLLRERLDREHGDDRRRWAVLLVPLAGAQPRTRRRTTLLVAGAACVLLLAGFGALRPDMLGRLAGEGSAADGGVHTAAADQPSPADANRDLDRRGGRAQRPSPTDRADGTSPVGAAAAPEDAGAAAEGATGVSIEVVDESGAHLRTGVVEIRMAPRLELGRVDFEKFAAWSSHLGEKSLADANPLVVRDLPREMGGLSLEATARVPGLPPTAPEPFVIAAGTLQSVRVTVVGPRTASVVVVDRRTDLPLGGASVVSATETRRRGVELRAVRGVAGPGSGVTDGAGRCTVADLGSGEHEFEIDAKGYLRGEATWNGDDLRVRLDPSPGTGTVTVRVLGPRGEPVPDVRVSMQDSDAVLRTDAAGACVFESVPPGFDVVSVDIPDWVAARRSLGWTAEGETYFANVDVEPGGRHDVELGWPRPGTATVSARIVDDAGRPVPGVFVKLLLPGGASRRETESDGAGVAVLEGVVRGRHHPILRLPDGSEWWFESVEISDGARLEPTWRLGSETVRGRTVGRDGRPIAHAGVSFVGACDGFASTDSDGRFVLRRAPAGTYEVEARVADGGARRAGVVVPSAEEIVLTLERYGRIEVKFREAERSLAQRAEFKVVTPGGDPGDGWRLMPGTSVEERLRSVDLLPGRYEVVVTDDGRTARFVAEVRPGETCVVEVRAP